MSNSGTGTRGCGGTGTQSASAGTSGAGTPDQSGRPAGASRPQVSSASTHRRPPALSTACTWAAARPWRSSRTVTSAGPGSGAATKCALTASGCGWSGPVTAVAASASTASR